MTATMYHGEPLDKFDVFFGRQDQHLKALAEALQTVYDTLGGCDMLDGSPQAVAYKEAESHLLSAITAVAKSYQDSKWLEAGTNYHDKP